MPWPAAAEAEEAAGAEAAAAADADEAPPAECVPAAAWEEPETAAGPADSTRCCWDRLFGLAERPKGIIIVKKTESGRAPAEKGGPLSRNTGLALVVRCAALRCAELRCVAMRRSQSVKSTAVFAAVPASSFFLLFLFSPFLSLSLFQPPFSSGAAAATVRSAGRGNGRAGRRKAGRRKAGQSRAEQGSTTRRQARPGWLLSVSCHSLAPPRALTRRQRSERNATGGDLDGSFV
jgi:hypothetical protein